MAYEKLMKNRRNIDKKPIATVGRGGVIYLNSAVTRPWLEGVKWVELFYDKNRHYLAVKKVKNETADSFRINYSSLESRSTMVIAARSVIKSLKIDYSKTRKFLAHWGQKNELLEIDLNRELR